VDEVEGKEEEEDMTSLEDDVRRNQGRKKTKTCRCEVGNEE
jgi:hypothetical protein